MPPPRVPGTRTSLPDSTLLGDSALRQLALTVLAQRAEPEGTLEGLAAAARGAYDALVRVSAPLIGQIGVDALIARAVHLAQREYPWLSDARGSDAPNEAFDRVITSMGRQNPATATEATAAVFAAFAGLLVTFIGEALTTRLLRKAWPDAFSDATARRPE